MQMSITWCLRSSWMLRCDCIDYDGTNFGYSQKSFEIRPYYGYRSVETLLIVPLQYCQEKSRIRAAMIARGKKFIALRGKHHRMYKGVAKLLAPNRICGQDGDENEFPQQSTVASQASVR